MPTYLDHGYDESVPASAWTLGEYRAAAGFRGGELLSPDAGVGEVGTPLSWRCAFGHQFRASPRLVLRGGHWCPTCVRRPEQYREQAERNQFLAQLEIAETSEALTR